MARNPSPKLAHRAKDLCTIEQAEEIARRVVDARAGYLIAAALETERSKRWHVRLRRWWNRTLKRMRKPQSKVST